MFTRARLSQLLVTVLCTVMPFMPASATGGVNSLVVHEWGTFTSVTTADREPQYWDPLNGPSELPGFVHRSWQDVCAKCGLWLARMETPVLYFYADKQMEISVDVGFPQGRITEWYPEARSVSNGIRWTRVELFPGEHPAFPAEQRESHYYPARDTDAAPVRASHASNPEWEKFLFYRGIANFDVPLRVGLCSDSVQVSGTGHQGIAQVILFENRGGRIGWSIHGLLNGTLSLPRPAPGQSAASLERELQKVLVSQGLYEKEAAAMVRTWSDSWFEEGLRVFYIFPRELTDTLLPLTITPQPAEINRVFVGRVEVITPEMEQQIEAAVQAFRSRSDEERSSAIRIVQRYGRFAEPVLRHLREAASSDEARTSIWALAVAAKQK
jgi:hypothetical protein